MTKDREKLSVPPSTLADAECNVLLSFSGICTSH